MFTEKGFTKRLNALLQKLELYGLREEDIQNAKELIAHSEYGVALELVVDQLYEYNVEIDKTIIKEIFQLGNEMELNVASWKFLEELIKDHQ